MARYSPRQSFAGHPVAVPTQGQCPRSVFRCCGGAGRTDLCTADGGWRRAWANVSEQRECLSLVHETAGMVAGFNMTPYDRAQCAQATVAWGLGAHVAGKEPEQRDLLRTLHTVAVPSEGVQSGCMAWGEDGY